MNTFIQEYETKMINQIPILLKKDMENKIYASNKEQKKEIINKYYPKYCSLILELAMLSLDTYKDDIEFLYDKLINKVKNEDYQIGKTYNGEVIIFKSSNLSQVHFEKILDKKNITLKKIVALITNNESFICSKIIEDYNSECLFIDFAEDLIKTKYHSDYLIYANGKISYKKQLLENKISQKKNFNKLSEKFKMFFKNKNEINEIIQKIIALDKELKKETKYDFFNCMKYLEIDKNQIIFPIFHNISLYLQENQIEYKEKINENYKYKYSIYSLLNSDSISLNLLTNIMEYNISEYNKNNDENILYGAISAIIAIFVKENRNNGIQENKDLYQKIENILCNTKGIEQAINNIILANSFVGQNCQYLLNEMNNIIKNNDFINRNKLNVKANLKESIYLEIEAKDFEIIKKDDFIIWEWNKIVPIKLFYNEETDKISLFFKGEKLESYEDIVDLTLKSYVKYVMNNKEKNYIYLIKEQVNAGMREIYLKEKLKDNTEQGKVLKKQKI